MRHRSLFQSFFLGGFECSTHRLHTGERRDLIHATAHDKFVLADYQRLREIGILSARDGLRWHLIETKPYHYDFSTVLPMIQAAQATGIQVIWDLFHYGWPEDIDVFTPEFVKRFRGLATAFTKLLANETDAVPFISPINEISYFSWAGGDAGYLNPFAFERSYELKVQLARTAIEGIEAIWDVSPDARIVHADPVINVVADPDRPDDQLHAEGFRLAQYQAWDMIAGRHWPALGGQEKYLDIIGINYYDHNQWLYNGSFLDTNHALYRPFSDILAEVYARYARPMFMAETGVEGDLRAGWLNYICDEVHTAIEAGVPIEGICLYPICDYPGWDDERCCYTGLWGYADKGGERELHHPLFEELQRQQRFFALSALHQTSKESVADLERPIEEDMNNRSTICLFTDSFDPSGMGEHMLILAAQLQDRYRVLFVSHEAAQNFITEGIAAEKLHLVHNGIRPELVERDADAVRTEFGLPATAKIVLTVACMTEQKGHAYLLDALPSIIEQTPDAYFIWVGEGLLEGDLRRPGRQRFSQGFSADRMADATAALYESLRASADRSPSLQDEPLPVTMNGSSKVTNQ